MEKRIRNHESLVTIPESKLKNKKTRIAVLAGYTARALTQAGYDDYGEGDTRKIIDFAVGQGYVEIIKDSEDSSANAA